MGVSLGFGSALLGKKATLLCTASVEEVIEDHYENQLGKIGEDEKDLKTKIEKFKGDEVNHKNTAYESGASRTGIYSIMDKIIRTGSKIAITISEKI
jgi:ubiquinone biosynthesis monooxygenase Coq7